MKLLKKSMLILGSTFLVSSLTGCSIEDLMFWKKKKDNTVQKDPLVIPTVDVTSLEVTLPELPERNVGEIRNDESYEYIDMYELSDFHGAVEYEVHSEGDYIGLPKLATYFENKRALNPGGTLLLSTGDMFQGSADSNLTRGYMVNYAMHYMGFDAMEIGNHEFDWTLEWMQKNAELTYNTHTIPYLGINIQKDGEMPSFLKKSTVVERGSYKIGVIGAIGSELESSVLKSALGGYEFVSFSSLVEAEAARLKSEENCDAVVLLAHEGVDEIPIVTGVDAAFGGHAHVDKVSATHPYVATENYGQSIAHIAFKFDKTTHNFVGVEEGYGLEVSKSFASSLEENSNVRAIMNQYKPEIDKIKNIKLGVADAKLAFNGALVNICTESMYEAALSAIDSGVVSGVDKNKVVAAFHNVNGGIRDDIAAGDITYGNVYKSFPFDNEVILFKLSGSEIRTKLANLSQLGCYRIFEKRDYFDSNEEYWIVTTDFLAFSENGMGLIKTLTDADLLRTGAVVREEVAQKVYKIDSLKNSQLLHAGDYHYSKIPNIF